MIANEHFQKAVERVLHHEGGLINHPSDPGGITNFGISKRWADKAGVRIYIPKLTREEAIEIYRDYFWGAYGLDRIRNEIIAIKVFDTLVNIGPAQCFKILQRALRCCSYKQIIDDGILGPVTLNASNLAIPSAVLTAFRSEQAGFYRLLAATQPKKQVFLNGWLKRAYDEI